MKTKTGIILKCGTWQFERLNGQLYLTNVDLSTNDLFQILIWIKKWKELDNEDVWQLELTQTDKEQIRPESLIKCLAGDNDWDLYWEVKWSEAVAPLLERFGSKIKDLVQRSKTLHDLKTRINTTIGSEDIVEFGLKRGLITIK